MKQNKFQGKEEASSKKKCRRQRIIKYFLQAAKEIIMKEGAESVTVRKVADLAGYSYPTLYHYFSDLNELLWVVKEDMIIELAQVLQKKMRQKQNKAGIEGVKEVFKIYTAYYFKNPNVFKFFNFFSVSKPSTNITTTEHSQTEPDYEAGWNEAFKSLVIEGKLCESDIEVVAKTIIYAVHGMITLCFSNNGDLTEEQVYRDLEKIIDHLILR